jgi:hypothetical protein
MSVTRFGGERMTLPGVTLNISSSGVLFESESEPDLGGPIEYTIVLNREGTDAVCLRCMGKVIRTGKMEAPAHEPAANFEVAATLERYEFVRSRVAN